MYIHTRIYLSNVVRLVLYLALAATLLATIIFSSTASAAASTQVISSSTTNAENVPGTWWFNRDVNTASPYRFDQQQQVMGEGALHVLPIGANADDKFIAEYFVVEDVSDVQAISYDFMIGSGGDDSDANEFYMNVYVNYDNSLDYGHCVYNVVPTTASGWTTVNFDPAQTYSVRTRGSAPIKPCPGSPSSLPAGAQIRAIALNVGDTSTNDVGLDGYFDNVFVQTTSQTITYDFDPYPVSGEITSPQADQVVRYQVDLTATYDDGDVVNDDGVQWAVRKNTCAVGGSNVAGNVGGFSNVASWDGASFAYSLDTSSFDDGDYCFIFNPSDDVGQDNVRETVEFYVNNVPAPDECKGIYDQVFSATRDGESIRATNNNDLIMTFGDRIKVRAEKGDDCIVIRGDKTSIRAGNGADTVVVEDGVDNSIRGENGADTIYAGMSSIVRAGNGADTVWADDDSRVYGDSGADLISVGNYSSVDGGTGNDTCQVGPVESTHKKCETIVL